MQTITRVFTGLIMICFISALQGQSPALEWVTQSGGTNTDQGYSIATDHEGNIITGGMFEASLDFDPGAGSRTIFSKGDRDGFIQKLDSNGKFLWAHGFGGVSNDAVNEITCDASGNIYAVGQFYGTVDFDPSASVNNLVATGIDGFILKLDKDGKFLWAKLVECPSSIFLNSIALDNAGGLYISGNYIIGLTYDNGSGVHNLSNSGSYDVFMLKLDVNGTFKWLNRIGGADSDGATNLIADLNNNIYLTGWFTATVDFDPTNAVSYVTSNGQSDYYIAKYKSNGDLIWAKGFGSIKHDLSSSLSTDNQGAVYMTGYFQETMDFDPGTGTSNLTAVAYNDGFIQKLDSNGDFVWVKQFSGTGGVSPTDIDMDADGNIYLTGIYSLTADVNVNGSNGGLTSAGNDDFFVLKLDNSANFQWVAPVGGIQADHAYSLVVSPSGKVYTTGYFFLTTDFDPSSGTNSLTSKGSCDFYVMKLGTCQGSSGTHAVTACAPYTWIDGNSYTTSNTTATYPVASGSGCDSVVTLNLSIIHVSDLSTSLSNGTIKATLANGSYRWLDCGNNYTPISGATSQSYTPTSNGSYAVEITENGCTDTSSCVAINNVGFASPGFGDGFTIYPNPSSGKFTVDLGTTHPAIHLRITDLSGKVILSKEFDATNSLDLMLDAAPGVYFMILETTDARAVFQLEKY